MTSKNEISPDFPFESKFVEVKGSRMHYVEEGYGDAILFIHGQPTSSYLWRNIIPHLTDYGRCIALDLIGFGKSDKPDIEYTFFDHVDYVEGFIERLKLQHITMVIHDWGSALGFHYAMRHEDNIRGLAFMEAILMPVSWKTLPAGYVEMLKTFRTPEVGWDMIVNKNIFIEQVLPQAIVRKLTDKEMDYYREPFKKPESRKPVWRWPNELPIDGEPENVHLAVETYHKKLLESDLPKLLFHASPGAIIPPPVVDWCKKNFRNLKTVDIGKGIHYLQEDNPHLIGSELAEWFQKL